MGSPASRPRGRVLQHAVRPGHRGPVLPDALRASADRDPPAPARDPGAVHAVPADGRVLHGRRRDRCSRPVRSHRRHLQEPDPMAGGRPQGQGAEDVGARGGDGVGADRGARPPVQPGHDRHQRAPDLLHGVDVADAAREPDDVGVRGGSDCRRVPGAGPVPGARASGAGDRVHAGQAGSARRFEGPGVVRGEGRQARGGGHGGGGPDRRAGLHLAAERRLPAHPARRAVDGGRRRAIHLACRRRRPGHRPGRQGRGDRCGGLPLRCRARPG